MEQATIFAVRQARYKSRFTLCEFPVAMYDALIVLIPKPGLYLDKNRLEALLAYLNSSFCQYYIEIHGRYIAKGPIALEVNIARDMPILDVRKLSGMQIHELAYLFDKLESEARRIGGASEKEIGIIGVEVNGVKTHTIVVFGDENVYLLGVVTLEELGLEVDPIKGELKPLELLLM
ncbi:MAG: hypothetical protein QXM89_05340 [Candidatus Bathyarchaeia archaeon]